jgi:hypothetical protein
VKLLRSDQKAVKAVKEVNEVKAVGQSASSKTAMLSTWAV